MNWKEENNRLTREFAFEDFSSAFAFIAQVALLAEKNNHHPRITNEWNKVELSLCTHDAGDVITDKDYALAREIDKILHL